jgi:hypothetical protein
MENETTLPTQPEEQIVEQSTVSGLFAQAAEMQDDSTPPTEITVNPADFGINLLDHNPEAEAIRAEDDKDGVAAPSELPHPHTRIERTAVLQDPVGDMKQKIDPFVDDFEIGPVEVTREERDAFVRSALHDTEMIFNIHLEGPDINVKVAIPPESFTTMVAQVLEMWDSQGKLDTKSNINWLLTFQQMHAWFQVREFAEKPTKWASWFDDGVPRISELRAKVENLDTFDDVINTGPTRLRMIVNAMALAEYKYKMCLDAWRTRAFFGKADTA